MAAVARSGRCQDLLVSGGWRALEEDLRTSGIAAHSSPSTLPFWSLRHCLEA